MPQTSSIQALIDIFRSSAEGLHSVTTQYAANDEAAELHPFPGSRGATPSSGKKAPSDITIRGVEEGAKGGKKRYKQHLLGDYSDSNNDETAGSLLTFWATRCPTHCEWGPSPLVSSVGPPNVAK
jgi:hypothetical protein